jgi:hypothetical protein
MTTFSQVETIMRFVAPIPLLALVTVALLVIIGGFVAVRAAVRKVKK